MEKRYFPAQIEEGPKSYGVWFVDLPGCVTAAKTVEAAIIEAEEALALHVWGMLQDKEEIPQPSAARLEEGSIAVAMVPVTMPGKKKRVNVMIDEGVLAAIDAVSDNRSQFLERAALKELVA